jgi:hypothetical protein
MDLYNKKPAIKTKQEACVHSMYAYSLKERWGETDASLYKVVS